MKTDIEYAALVMGIRVEPYRFVHPSISDDPTVTEGYVRVTSDGINFLHRDGSNHFSSVFECFWNPLYDDGDSRRLEIACMKWMARHALSSEIEDADGDLEWFRRLANNTPEEYRAAVLALAVAIGKVVDGGGV
jgi:hypothetical protein